MPFAEAQSYFNREGMADEIEVMVADPDRVEDLAPALLAAGNERTLLWSWRDSAGAFLRALDIEDNVMFVILSVLVLIAAMNIISGLIMLVKNKGRDIGILRTMGLTEGSILRIFFLCGASTGLVGTALGRDPGLSVRHLHRPDLQPRELCLGRRGLGPLDPGHLRAAGEACRCSDVLSAVALSLGLSFIVTIFPARRAARMNPVEALRYE